MAEITTMLLDVDGTFVDSNDAHARAWTAAFAEADHAVPYTAIRPLIGMGADQLLPAISRALSADREPGATIARRRGEIFRERYLADVRPMPGSRALLLALKAQQVRAVVATSASRSELDALLAIAGIDDLVDATTSSEDAESTKPAPDIVLAGLRRANVDADHAVMLGDTKFDIAAASRAGVPTIALRCGGSDPADLAGSAAVYDDPTALARALETRRLGDIVG